MCRPTSATSLFEQTTCPAASVLATSTTLAFSDHVIARSHRRRVRRIERTPCGFDRDRAHGQVRRMGRIGQVLALAPAMNRQRRILGFVEAPFVARIGPILRHQRIGADAGQEGGLIEIHEGREGRERLLAIVDVRSARVRRLVGRPGLWRDRASVRTDLEQFIAGLEGLPDAGARDRRASWRDRGRRDGRDRSARAN